MCASDLLEVELSLPVALLSLPLSIFPATMLEGVRQSFACEEYIGWDEVISWEGPCLRGGERDNGWGEGLLRIDIEEVGVWLWLPGIVKIPSFLGLWSSSMESAQLEDMLYQRGRDEGGEMRGEG